MYDDDDDDRSDWEKARNDAAIEHLDEVALGVPLNDLPDDLWEEADGIAREVVWPGPDEPSGSRDEEE